MSPASAASWSAWLKPLAPAALRPSLSVYVRAVDSSATSASKKTSPVIGVSTRTGGPLPLTRGGGEKASSASSRCFSRKCLCTNSGPRNSLRQTAHRNLASPTGCVRASQNSRSRRWCSASADAEPPARGAFPAASLSPRSRASSSRSWRLSRATSISARRRSTSARRTCSAPGPRLAAPPPGCRPRRSISACSRSRSRPRALASCCIRAKASCMGGLAQGLYDRHSRVSSTRSLSRPPGKHGNCPRTFACGSCIWLRSEKGSFRAASSKRMMPKE
mmetsp:Transcript_98715/g.274684  ORF Transcript_98715/g.274684 Transcript_98715/m.274684 type:complete len:276 (+) Transcript_98715:675-1502(+)